MTSVFILIIAMVGLSFIFGGFKAERLSRLAIWLLLAPLVLCFVQSAAYNTYSELSPLARIGFLIVLTIVVLLVLRRMFPNTRWLWETLLNVLVYLVTLPVRILWRSLWLILDRERHPVRLSPTPVVVGTRPQIESPKKKVSGDPTRTRSS